LAALVVGLLATPHTLGAEQADAHSVDWAGAEWAARPGVQTQLPQVAAGPNGTPRIPGPKRTIAVGKFDAIGAFTAEYGEWDIGGGLAAMLTTALMESGQFIVIERANLSQILTEQEMSANRVSVNGPGVGRLSGVHLLVYGAVTEFGDEDEGGGLGIGYSGGPLGDMFNTAVAVRGSTGAVGMDLRIVDTTTGQILESHRIRESIDSSGLDVSFGYRGISFGGDQFRKTPIGEASRRAIRHAVARIANRVVQTPWTGRVVEFDGREMYINAGGSSGLRVGDQFVIEKVVKQLTDPVTGELLSTRKREIGVLQLTGVEAKISYGTYTPLDSAPPQRGDLVLVVHR
jgi:curli biogenesis system outer membrane secretion channel CsgG